MSDYMSDLALSNALFESQAIAAGRITVRMVMDACMLVPKLKGRLSFDDIKRLHAALDHTWYVLPHHMKVLLDALTTTSAHGTQTSPPDEFAALRKAAEAATPGPWMWHEIFRTVQLQDRHNMAFIAAANPAVVLKILDELEATRAKLKELNHGR